MASMKELFEARRKIDTEMNEILDRAEFENRGLSDEENDRFWFLDAENRKLRERQTELKKST
jgi:hypothetical protein